MKVVKIRVEHKCEICGGEEQIGAKMLMTYVDMRTWAGRKYYCFACAHKELKRISDELGVG